MTRSTRSLLLSLLPLVTIASGLAALTPAEAGKYATKAPVETKEIGDPAEGKATLYVLRSTNLGAAIYVWTFLDDELFAVTRGKAFVVGQVDPGRYVVWSKAENVSATTLEVEAGQTYFVKQVILPGFGKARTRVELLEAAEGRRLLDRIKKESRVTDEGRTKATEIALRHLDRARRRALEEDNEED